MKYIIKGKTPSDLEAYRKTDGACYDGLDKDVKNNLRNNLFQEQGGLCCYCMGRIANDYTTTIEHLKPKERGKYPELQLDYSNLLLSCDGGKAERSLHDRRQNRNYPLHCDAQKNDMEIGISPLDEDCETHFMYGDEGEIFGKDELAKETIRILNLDIPYLRNQRKQVFNAYADLELSKEEWDEEIEFLRARDQNGCFSAYCIAIVSYIERYKIEAIM